MASPLSYGLIFQCALWVDPKIYDLIRLNVKKNHENDYYTDIVVLKTEMIMKIWTVLNWIHQLTTKERKGQK